MSDYDQISAALERSWGAVQQPNYACMTLRAYWMLRKWADPHVKLPRKLKKRLFGTRSARRRGKKHVWEPKIATFELKTELFDLKITEEPPE